MRFHSPKRARRERRYKAAKREVAVRSGGLCEAKLIGCTGKAQDVHHRRGRIGDDLFDVDLLLAVCRACHDWIGDHPAAAMEAGLLLSRLGTVTPPVWAQEDAS